MTHTLRQTPTAVFFLLALMLAMGAAVLRPASLVNPAVPAVYRHADITAPDGPTPARAADGGAAAPNVPSIVAPAQAPASDATPAFMPAAPAVGPNEAGPTTTSPVVGSKPVADSAAGGSAVPAGGYGAVPSRWSEWPNDTPPAYLAPAQPFGKRPVLGNGL